MPRILTLSLLLALALPNAGCRQTITRPNDVTVVGQVLSTTGDPAPHALVTAEGAVTVGADENGRYTLHVRDAGATITVRAAQAMTPGPRVGDYSGRTTVTRTGPRLRADIVLDFFTPI